MKDLSYGQMQIFAKDMGSELETSTSLNIEQSAVKFKLDPKSSNPKGFAKSLQFQCRPMPLKVQDHSIVIDRTIIS
jgi:hypothetical protein